MPRSISRLLFSLPVLGLLSGQALALGIRLPDQNAAATARGEAFAATADNPSALYYNPAGITQLEGDQFSLGVFGIDLKSEYTSPSGVTAETDNDIQYVPQFYYTHQFKNVNIVAGLAIYSPYGLSNEYPDDSPFRTIAKKGSIQYLTIAPTIALKATSTLSVAVGLNYNRATAELSQGFLYPGDETKFKGDDGSLSARFGVLWQPTPQHSFGLTWQTASQMEFEGGFEIKGSPSVPRQDATAVFNFPQNIVLGYSFRPTPDWNFEFNYDWTDWNDLNDVFVVIANGGGVVGLPFNWQNSSYYEFGVTRYLPHGFSISAGYIYSENSVPEENFTPLVPDSDRHIFSLGMGYKSAVWSVDLAYQYAHGPERTISHSISRSLIGETANGTYEFNSHALNLTVGFHF